jgi:heterodisulfide reductase subunit E
VTACADVRPRSADRAVLKGERLDRLSLFWVLITLSILLFLAGLWMQASIWLAGSVEGATGSGKVRKLWIVGGRVVRGLLGRKGAQARKALFVEGLLQPRLASAGKGRWLAHAALSHAFFAMFMLSMFTGVFEQGFHNILGLSSPFINAVIDKDTPIIAVLNEGLGALMVIGLAFFVVRRYILRPAQLRTTPLDTWTLVLLGLGLLTAYPLEALRFLTDGAPATGAWASFGGYSLSLLLKPLAWPWARLHTWMFFAHVLPLMALLVYMPFSKFFHLLVSPLVATANRADEEATR